MPNRQHTPIRFRLHVVSATLEIDFEDDETPTLPGIRVYDTSAEEVTQARPLAKCGTVRDERKKAAR